MAPDPHQEVVWFDVPMDEILVVDVLDPPNHLVSQQEDGLHGKSPRAGLGDNCQILAVRSDICKIGQLSDRTTVSADNCQIRQLSDRTTVRSDNCQIGQLSVGQLSVGHGQLSEKTVSALKKL